MAKTTASKPVNKVSITFRRAKINLIRKDWCVFKFRIQNRKKRWWWNIVHYNYFHKKLFKEYYIQKKSFTKWQTRKYKLYILLDDLITLRFSKLWLKTQFKLER